jgi:hypothetical protein
MLNHTNVHQCCAFSRLVANLLHDTHALLQIFQSRGVVALGMVNCTDVA